MLVTRLDTRCGAGMLRCSVLCSASLINECNDIVLAIIPSGRIACVVQHHRKGNKITKV